MRALGDNFGGVVWARDYGHMTLKPPALRIILYVCSAILHELQSRQTRSKMSEYSGFGGGSGGNLQAADRGRLMDQVRSQIAVASAQELIQVHINFDY